MSTPSEIQHAIEEVSATGTQAAFLQRFLVDTLHWPIDPAAKTVEDTAYEWPLADLAGDLTRKVVDNTIWQIQTNPGAPWGIFLIEFVNEEAFTTDRGMNGPLRRILRSLVEKKRGNSANLPVWKREHLLFICTHRYQHFRFAYFKAPDGQTKTAPLATFGFGGAIPARTACTHNLPALHWPATRAASPHSPPDAASFTAAWSEAFNVERVTREFYNDYREVFEATESAIASNNPIQGEELRLYTQSLFNRLMFLRFIERKGWLTWHRHPADDPTAPKDYLAQLFAAGLTAELSFFQSRLIPLFFEGLAKPHPTESHSPAYGTVPFLNGGLFEMNDRDAKVTNIPDHVFTKILDTHSGLFYHYNFTVEESTPLDIEVAVDPEMLGKVFEELVNRRHESGSYYTPRPVVSFMCREALKGFLETATNTLPAVIAAIVDDHNVTDLDEPHAREIIVALDRLKALDPACGSGAYLLGLLHEIASIYQLLYNRHLPGDARSLYELKLRIIGHNLYGVDLDPFATSIAMLRLWLSLSVDSLFPEALPNLEFKIETGDSLLGPSPRDMPDLFGSTLQSVAGELVQFKEEYLVAHGSKKAQRREVITQKQDRIAAELRAIHGPGVIDWRIQFAEVFLNNHGFDIVLANPPYINSRDMAKSNLKLRKIISEMYEMTRGSWDIYIAFYERAFQLLAPQGVLSFITPDKWISKPFGDELRKRTTDRIASILKAGRNVFDTVNVDAIVTIYRNFPQKFLGVYNFTSAGVELKRMVSKENIKAPFTYDWLFSEYLPLLEKIESNPGRLSHLAMCENACATDDAYRLREFIHEQPGNVPADQMLMINTGTIGKYVSRWGARKMTYLGEHFLRPAISREEFLRAFPKSYGQKSCRKKLIVKGLNLLDACLDVHGNIVPGIPTLIVADDDIQKLKLLLALLNSPVAIFYIRQKYAGSSYNGGITFTKEMINDLPIPQLTAADQEQLVSLVDRIIDAKTHYPAADTSYLEHDLNARIHALYSLTPGEIES